MTAARGTRFLAWSRAVGTVVVMRTAIAALFVSAGLLCAACGPADEVSPATGAPTSSEPPAGVSVTDEEEALLAGVLITLDDLPEGWSEVPEPEGEDDDFEDRGTGDSTGDAFLGIEGTPEQEEAFAECLGVELPDEDETGPEPTAMAAKEFEHEAVGSIVVAAATYESAEALGKANGPLASVRFVRCFEEFGRAAVLSDVGKGPSGPYGLPVSDFKVTELPLDEPGATSASGVRIEMVFDFGFDQLPAELVPPDAPGPMRIITDMLNITYGNRVFALVATAYDEPLADDVRTALVTTMTSRIRAAFPSPR